MALLSEEATTALPVWTLSDVEEALLKRMSKMLSEPEHSSWPESEEEEKPCWWILSALDRLDGREAREGYYVKL